MTVMFRTQQGRTLRNDDRTVDDMTEAIYRGVFVSGYELGSQLPTRFYVATRHVVEWWDPDEATS